MRRNTTFKVTHAECISGLTKADVIACQFIWDENPNWLLGYAIEDWKKHKRSFTKRWTKIATEEDKQFLPAKLKKCPYARRVNICFTTGWKYIIRD